MLIKEIMSSSVESVEPGLSIAECARKMRDLDIGCLPVLNNGQLIGMITDRDICCRAVADERDVAKSAAEDIMTKDVTFCFDDQDCEDAAHLMEEKHLRRLVVLSREKATVGVLSVDNLACCSHDLAGGVLEAAAPSAH